MKKRKGILTGLIAACAACIIAAASCSQSPPGSNKAPSEALTVTVSVRYLVDDVEAVTEFCAKLTELTIVRYLMHDARAAVALYTTHLGIAADLTAGRARSMVGAVVGLISLIVGGLALARSAGRNRNARTVAIVALVLGLIGVVLSVVHLGSSTGFGTGGGRAGAIVALVLALVGMTFGGLALARTRRSRSTG